ncbi:hypothetical protein HDU86_002447 [Geranomyces michiganensis]|nr:hypothetical protein HDU86_002447 [Geranomyces michiganensis]
MLEHEEGSQPAKRRKTSSPDHLSEEVAQGAVNVGEAINVNDESGEDRQEATAARDDQAIGREGEGEEEAELTLSTKLLETLFKNVKAYNSKKRFTIGATDVNLSKWFRDAQHHLLQQAKQKMTFKFKHAQICDILLFNNIALMSTEYTPSFVLETRNKNVPPSWRRIVRNLQKEKIAELTADGASDALVSFLQEVRRSDDFEDVFARHLGRNAESARSESIRKGLRILRSFKKTVDKRKAFNTMKIGLANEHTVVHDFIHTLFEEGFADDTTAVVWTNSESASSKDHRRTYRRKAKGKKPDGVVRTALSEEMVFETKGIRYTGKSQSTIYDLFKLAQLLQGSLNAKVDLGVDETPQVFGIQALRASIETYVMTLDCDGTYQMLHIESSKMPDLEGDLMLGIDVISLTLGIKEALRKNSSAVGHPSEQTYDLDLHLSSPVSSPVRLGLPETPAYKRMPVPTPVKQRGIPPFLNEEEDQDEDVRC